VSNDPDGIPHRGAFAGGAKLNFTGAYLDECVEIIRALDHAAIDRLLAFLVATRARRNNVVL